MQNHCIAARDLTYIMLYCLCSSRTQGNPKSARNPSSLCCRVVQTSVAWSATLLLGCNRAQGALEPGPPTLQPPICCIDPSKPLTSLVLNFVTCARKETLNAQACCEELLKWKGFRSLSRCSTHASFHSLQIHLAELNWEKPSFSY